jgi:Transposase IS4
MIKWTGKGEMHITIMPRKPCSSGFIFDMMCCSLSNIVLMAQINEGKEKMATKEYRDQVGASTAVTLRMVKPYKGT